MLATIQIGRLVCAYNGQMWDCDDPRLTRQLNEFTRQYTTFELQPASGDPVLAVIHATIAMFGAQPITLPPPAPAPGEGAVE